MSRIGERYVSSDDLIDWVEALMASIVPVDRGGTGQDLLTSSGLLVLKNGAIAGMITGADPTGATDSGAAIQAGLSADTRGVRYLPDGDYTFADDITVPSGVSLIGIGSPLRTGSSTTALAGQPTLRYTGSAGNGLVLANSATVQNISLINTGSGTIGMNVTGTNTRISGCFVGGWATDGIALTGGYQPVIELNRFSGNGTDIHAVSAITAAKIRYNTFLEATAYHIDLDSTPSQSSGISITDNDMSGTPAAGYSIRMRANTVGVTVAGNRFEPVAASGFLQMDDNSSGLTAVGNLCSAPSGDPATSLFLIAGPVFALIGNTFGNATNGIYLDTTARRGVLLGNDRVAGTVTNRINNNATATNKKSILIYDYAGLNFGGGGYDFPFMLGTYSLWVSSAGKLYIKDGTPSTETDGTVVGGQS